MATLIETVSISATESTRLRHPIDVPRPRYPDRAVTGPASSPAEVAAFFGMVYVPALADDQED